MRFSINKTTFEASFFVVSVMSIVLILDASGKVAMCFLCAILHECGHIIAMRCFGVTPKSIKLRLFDIAIETDSSKTFLSDFIVTLSGPFMNLGLSLLFYFVYKPLCLINLVIGLFNLMPIDTFDGGHALSLLLLRKLSPSTTRVILKVLTFAFLLPLFLCGILVLFYSKYNYSLLLISLYLLAILFLK